MIGTGLCLFCKHYHGSSKCDAYPGDWPKNIPDVFMSGVRLHIVETKGDHGIQFEEEEGGGEKRQSVVARIIKSKSEPSVSLSADEAGTASSASVSPSPKPPQQYGGKLPFAHNELSNPLLGDESRPHFEKHETGAINNYTASAYEGINHALRFKRGQFSDPIHQAHHESLQSAFSKVKKFSKPVTVYRSSHAEDPHLFATALANAGKNSLPIEMHGYTSTSTRPDLNPRVPIQYQIEAHHGLDAQPYSNFTSEDELLLNHRSKFHVLGVSKTGDDSYRIKLRQVVDS